MIFEWNPTKSDRNFTLRGFGFEVAVPALDHVLESWVDNRRDYGETRIIAKCRFHSEILVIVYTIRDDCCRIISVRRANKRERRGHEAH